MLTIAAVCLLFGQCILGTPDISFTDCLCVYHPLRLHGRISLRDGSVRNVIRRNEDGNRNEIAPAMETRITEGDPLMSGAERNSAIGIMHRCGRKYAGGNSVQITVGRR